jgi:hypothetical protein
MKIILLVKRDCAGSGSDLYRALKQEHEVSMFRVYCGNPYNHELEGECFRGKKQSRQVQELIDTADVVHIKGDDPFFHRLTFNHKLTVITVSGSIFRRKRDGGFGRFPMTVYRRFKKTAFTTDLCYERFKWIPQPYPKGTNLWKKSDPPVLVHSPTNREIKNTDFILQVFEKIQKTIPCEVDIIEKVKFKEADERRKRATIFFDQFKLGAYAKSAVEAMRYGIPVAAWLSEKSKNVHGMEGCPVLTWDMDVDLWANEIVKILSTDMQELNTKTCKWFDEKHSYQAVLDRINKIYKN